MNTHRSAPARWRVKSECTAEFKPGLRPSPPKWLLLPLLAGSLCTAAIAADPLQQYEKAYYLESAKGNDRAAAAIYKEIADAEPTEANREAIRKSLLRLLHIGTLRRHEPTIRDCHEKLLTKTDFTPAELIALVKAGETIIIPPGTYSGTLLIDKNLTLKGAGRNSCILEAEADRPLIQVSQKAEVTLEGLTLKSRRATSERTDPPGCALWVKDANVTLKDCAVVATGNTKRCPLGVYVEGFSEAHLLDSRFEGYAYPIFYTAGTEGRVKGCTVSRPGDCGFMSHADSEVTIEGNIFYGSAKHGVRSTGGTLHLQNNLIVKNRNRGIYLGNKTTHGKIINNAIIENGSGISTFASSDIEIENNVILANEYSGLDTRCYGKIQVKNNIIADNRKSGFTVYEKGSNKFKISKNTFYGNGTPATDYDLPSSTLEENPTFTDAKNGDFTPKNSAVKSAQHGLIHPAAITALWQKYAEASK